MHGKIVHGAGFIPAWGNRNLAPGGIDADVLRGETQNPGLIDSFRAWQ
jgi:hypothetical protein